MSLISVVIPCYNHGVFIEEAVDSVLMQSYQDFEIIIVNDGSTDQYTNDLLHNFNKKKCTVKHTANNGLSAARNFGILCSGGEYICCLDADDKYHPEYFAKALAVFESDVTKRYGAVPPWVQFFGTREDVWKTVGSNTEGFYPYLQGVRNNFQSATMFRRECWETVGGFAEHMIRGYEDWDFWLKLLENGFEFYCIEEPLIFYRQKEMSMVKNADKMRFQLMEGLLKEHQQFYAQYFTEIFLELDKEIMQLKKTMVNHTKIHPSNGQNNWQTMWRTVRTKVLPRLRKLLR